ncbi:15841_t:CDS:2, partial [Gigaspora rosea]
TVSSNTFEGVKVTLGYFDDILIPTHNDDEWKFDHKTQVWVRLWDSQIPDLYMYMDKNTTIKFRVIDEKFSDISTKFPPPKRTGAVVGQKAPMPSSSLPLDDMIVGNNRGEDTQNVKTDTTTYAPTGGKLVPYELIGSIAEVGLGLTLWKWE